MNIEVCIKKLARRKKSKMKKKITSNSQRNNCSWEGLQDEEIAEEEPIMKKVTHMMQYTNNKEVHEKRWNSNTNSKGKAKHKT